MILKLLRWYLAFCEKLGLYHPKILGFWRYSDTWSANPQYSSAGGGVIWCRLVSSQRYHHKSLIPRQSDSLPIALQTS